MKVSVETYNKGEREFNIYTLINDNNITVEVLSLGGVITKILVPDKEGKYENIVLAYEDLNDYYENKPHFGSIVGRTAGRIGGGEVIIKGDRIVLTKNNNGNTLHGGEIGLHNKIWSGEEVKTENTVGVKLRYISKHGESGYPGNVNIEVYYSLNNENELIVTYSGTTDKTTLLNLSNHSYFNLSGNGKQSILNHELRINSKKFAEIDDKSIVTGKIIDVKDTPFNFLKAKKLGRDIGEIKDIQIARGSGYDHPWILNNNDETDLCFKDQVSGRTMVITTDAKAVVCYSMNFAAGGNLSCGKTAIPRMGCCFETQSLPIGYNGEFKEDSILVPEEQYKTTTIFKFS